MSTPYTHAMHGAKCVAAAKQGIVLSQKGVQVRRGTIVYCARIVEALTLDRVGDCWTVVTIAPHTGRITVPVRNVRECEGVDGRCSCAAQRELNFCQAGVVAPPDSLMYETPAVLR